MGGCFCSYTSDVFARTLYDRNCTLSFGYTHRYENTSSTMSQSHSPVTVDLRDVCRNFRDVDNPLCIEACPK